MIWAPLICGVGALSNGTAGLSKAPAVAKAAGITNFWAVKALTAGAGEVVKGMADDKKVEEHGSNAAVAAVLNASGVVGKAAGYVAKKSGAVVDGLTPDPQIAALLQPKAVPATPPAAAAAITESLGAAPNYALQYGAAEFSSALGASSSGGTVK